MKRIRIVALLVGLAADLIGTLLFSVALSVVIVMRHGEVDWQIHCVRTAVDLAKEHHGQIPDFLSKRGNGCA